MKLENSMKQLTFGVSFNHMFKLLDMWGEIADDILYRNKYFSTDYFSNISENYTTERRLTNPTTGNLLVLSANNLVYTHNIGEEYSQEYSRFVKRIKGYLVPEILSARGLIVRRLGVVYVSEHSPEVIERFSSFYFKPTIKGICDFRFSKKETTKDGLLYADKQDFINKIFSVGNSGEIKQRISYDYQLHFNPIRQDVRDSIDSFLSMSNKAFCDDVLNRLEEGK